MTLSITTFGIEILRMMTLSITAFSKTTLRIKDLIGTLGTTTVSVVLRIIMMSVIILNVIVLNVVAPVRGGGGSEV